MTLRLRLTLAIVLGLGVVLTLSSLGVYYAVESRLQRSVESGLRTIVEASSPSVLRPGPVDGRPVPDPPFWSDHWVVVRDSNTGEVLRRSGESREAGEALAVPAAADRLVRVELPDGRPGWALRVTVVAETPARGPRRRGFRGGRGPGRGFGIGPRGGPEDRPPGPGARRRRVEMTIARDATETDSQLRGLARTLTHSLGLSLAVAALLVAWLVGRGLRPLRSLHDQIAEVDATALDHIFEVDSAPAELVPVVAQLNELVERMRSALEREHNFAASAAHELRTPLAGLRMTIEVALGRERGAPEYRDALERSLAVSDDLERLVETLLTLARSGQSPVECQPIRLAEFVGARWDDLGSAPESRGLTIDSTIPESLEIESSPPLLARIVGNLLENASAYADRDSVVGVTFVPETSRLVVENVATGVSPEVAEHATEPFWREDRARSQTGLHAGLGLALVESLAEALSLELTLEVEDGRFRAGIGPFVTTAGASGVPADPHLPSAPSSR